MRGLDELLSDNPAWPEIEQLLVAATNELVVLPVVRSRGEETLLLLQVTSRSFLGALALETGGILVDHGWLRMLGSGAPPRMKSSLSNWNALGVEPAVASLEGALVVAFDAVGGVFAINGGAFAGDPGAVFHFGPDSLEWEQVAPGHAEFVRWALSGNLDQFYGALRWPGWQDELAGCRPDLGFSLYPPPFTVEGRQVANASRKLIAMAELWGFELDMAAKLAQERS